MRRASNEEMQRMFGGKADAGQHLLGVTGHCSSTFPGHSLGHGGHLRCGFVPGGMQQSGCGLNRHQPLGEAMTHGLERGDRSAELHPFQGVRSGQVKHGAGCADQFMPQRQLTDRHRIRPVDGTEVFGITRRQFTRNLMQAKCSVEPGDGALGQLRNRHGHASNGRPIADCHHRSATSSVGVGSNTTHGNLSLRGITWRQGLAQERQYDDDRIRRHGAAHRERQQVIERSRSGVGPTQVLEHHRHRSSTILGHRVQPAQFGQGCIELSSIARRGHLLHRAAEEFEFGLLH